MEKTRTKSLFAVLYSLPFLLAAGLSVLMLATDKNLQTDFGAMSSGYYSHWYFVLATAVADLVGAGILLTLRSRFAVKLGVLGSAALATFLVGVIFTYQQVGFASAGDFANYLFGVTYYGGYIRYLYDALLATYIGTVIFGVVGLALTRETRSPATPKESGNLAST
jgi:hypothetical protein